MSVRTVLVAMLWAMASCSGSAVAASVSVQGTLPLDSDPAAVYAYTFTLAAPSAVTLQTYGWGGTANAPGGVDAAGVVVPAGGFDPYLSLFAGTGPTATFLASNDDGPCPPGTVNERQCRDARIAQTLPAGSYTVVLSAFKNMSFAENLGAGTLGDGFIGIVPYDASRSHAYALDVDNGESPPPPLPPTPVPIVTGGWQAGLSLLVLALALLRLRAPAARRIDARLRVDRRH